MRIPSIVELAVTTWRDVRVIGFKVVERSVLQVLNFHESVGFALFVRYIVVHVLIITLHVTDVASVIVRIGAANTAEVRGVVAAIRVLNIHAVLVHAG